MAVPPRLPHSCAAEMNVAYAWHEGIADHVVPCLAWFNSGGELNLQAGGGEAGMPRAAQRARASQPRTLRDCAVSRRSELASEHASLPQRRASNLRRTAPRCPPPVAGPGAAAVCVQAF